MKFLKEIIPYVLVVALALIIRTFVFTPVRVDGASMYPTLENNQVLVLKKYANNYQRFDIVVVKYNQDRLVKRIIGLPGETIEYKNNILYVDGKKVEEPIKVETNDFSSKDLGSFKIPSDCYLVLGDNRSNSTDSRIIGFINKEDILGITNLRIWPLNKIGFIKNA